MSLLEHISEIFVQGEHVPVYEYKRAPKVNFETFGNSNLPQIQVLENRIVAWAGYESQMNEIIEQIIMRFDHNSPDSKYKLINLSPEKTGVCSKCEFYLEKKVD